MGVTAALIQPALAVLKSLKSLGLVGRLLYMFGLAVWVVMCGPTTPIELASGFVFPLTLSTALSVAGKTMGNLVAFVLGRRILKPVVSRMLSAGGGTSASVHRHLLGELKLRPIQTMSILRAAPLPTPFKIYGLCLFPPELVPLWTYATIALVFNTCWSVVWSLAGSSASNLQDVLNGKGSGAELAGRLSTLLAFFGILVAFGRFAAAKMQPPTEADTDADAAPAAPKAVAANGSTRPGGAKGAAAVGDAPVRERSRSSGRARANGAADSASRGARSKSPRTSRKVRAL